MILIASTVRSLPLQFRRFISMTSIAPASTKPEGHIWIYKPKHGAKFPSSLQAVKDASSPIKCPLPKVTPPIEPENRLHNSKSSLKAIHQSKADFYLDQFIERVSEEDVDRIEKCAVQSPHSSREVDVTIYRPHSTPIHQNNSVDSDTQSKLNGICLHVHGGGWLWGDSQFQVAHRCLEMASHLNAAVVSVEYSLLHHKIFDPVRDVFAALEWVEYCGPEMLNTENRLVASGESSGAHLLMLAMIRRRKKHNHQKKLQNVWKCLNLVYGVFDLSGTASIRNDGDKSVPLCGDELLWMYDLYCSKVQKEEATIDNNSATFSPLYADLSKLPPALITVGTADPLLHDSLLMAAKYSSKNDVELELAIYEGAEHGIGHFGVQENEEMGVQARNYTLNFMGRHLNRRR